MKQDNFDNFDRLVGLTLRHIRKGRKIPCSVIAKKLGVTNYCYYTWERGQVSITLKNLILLLDIYQVKLETFLAMYSFVKKDEEKVLERASHLAALLATEPRRDLKINHL